MYHISVALIDISHYFMLLYVAKYLFGMSFKILKDLSLLERNTGFGNLHFVLINRGSFSSNLN